VSHDKAFLRIHMPALHAFLHFRVVDVSSINEVMRRWLPGRLQAAPRKQCAHTAMADIMESLAELRWYKSSVFGVKDRGLVTVHPFVADEPAAP